MITKHMTAKAKQNTRAIARQILKKAGHDVNKLHKLADLQYAVEVHLGRDCQGDPDEFIAEFAQEYGPSLAPPRTPPTFRPLQISPQMRINQERARAHQPSLITPKGFGNGEGRFGFWPGY